MFSDIFIFCNSIRSYFDNLREEIFHRAKYHLFCRKSSNHIACFHQYGMALPHSLHFVDAIYKVSVVIVSSYTRCSRHWRNLNKCITLDNFASSVQVEELAAAFDGCWRSLLYLLPILIRRVIVSTGHADIIIVIISHQGLFPTLYNTDLLRMTKCLEVYQLYILVKVARE